MSADARAVVGALALIACAILAAIALGACTARQARSEADIEACYAAVDAGMLTKVRALCAGGRYDACPAYDALNAEWAEKAKACE